MQIKRVLPLLGTLFFVFGTLSLASFREEQPDAKVTVVVPDESDGVWKLFKRSFHAFRGNEVLWDVEEGSVMTGDRIFAAISLWHVPDTPRKLITLSVPGKDIIVFKSWTDDRQQSVGPVMYKEDGTLVYGNAIGEVLLDAKNTPITPLIGTEKMTVPDASQVKSLLFRLYGKDDVLLAERTLPID